MSRISLPLVTFITLAFTLTASAAGPSDLLNQAIKENDRQNRPAAASGDLIDADRLALEAERLANEGSFREAVGLYERAYRLDPSNRAMYARLLVSKRAAGVMTQQDREALALLEEEQAAEIDQVFRRVRLAIIQGRQALRSGDATLAARHVDAAETALDALPGHIDVSPYRRELSDLSNAAKRRAARGAARAADPGRGEARIEADGSDLYVTRRAGEAMTLMDAGDDMTAASAETYRDYRHVETGRIIEIDEALYGDQAVHAYERELSAALNRRRAQNLIHQQIAAMPPMPEADLAYPHDWAEKTARRSEYRDGVIHEGAPFVGPDGQTYQTVIYDLAELVHPVPNFYAAYPGTAREQRMQSLDRHYIRERSMIFNGWPEDLAAGLPLLHFFGGIDNNAFSTRTDPYETQRIVETLNRFINSR